MSRWNFCLVSVSAEEVTAPIPILKFGIGFGSQYRYRISVGHYRKYGKSQLHICKFFLCQPRVGRSSKEAKTCQRDLWTTPKYVNVFIDMYLGSTNTQNFHSIRWKSGPLVTQVCTFGEGYTLYKKTCLAHISIPTLGHRELEQMEPSEGCEG